MPHEMEFAWSVTDDWITAAADGLPFMGAPVTGPEARYQLHPSKLGTGWAGLAGQSMRQKRLAEAILKIVDENTAAISEALLKVKGGQGVVKHSHMMYKGVEGFPGFRAVLQAAITPGANATLAKSALSFQYCYGVCVGCQRAKQAFLTTPLAGLELPSFYLLPEHLSQELDIGYPQIACYCADCKVRCIGCKKNGVVFGMTSNDLRAFAIERLCETCRAGRLVEVKAPKFDRSVAKRLSHSRYIMVD